ncbi:soluble quino protein glucose dehydrogenase [Apiospora marii]|uniref:Soluble quino protein glucose dehydrogenase n=1 Tax=Apiospora marii TaxID=335849 RepID=A0ABR1RYI8_9PEZI
MKLKLVAEASALFAATAAAQQYGCLNVLKPSYQAPVVGSGWTAQLVAKDLKDPRGIIFDTKGHLLVVEQESGIKRLTFDDKGGTCLVQSGSETIVGNKDLNHGITFSNDGKTLYASSDAKVLSWAYDPESGTTSGDARTVVENLDGGGHSTRTLLMSAKQPGMLLVSKGSGGNVDSRAKDVSTGVSQIRAFNMTNATDTPYDYAAQGRMLGWGLRNSVGVAEEPKTGGIFSVENSVDEMFRDGADVHQDNPGEELNFHGFLNASTEGQGGNYGYPDCFALWHDDIPDSQGLRVGSQFTQNQSSTLNDTTCSQERVAPRLTFQAHTAPLDIKFASDGKTAFIAFHGSWNRDNPAGYKLSTIAFSDGQPTEPPTSTTATSNILSNADNSACPDGCFRPVGLAVDGQGRVYMSSDTTGEIWVLKQSDISTGTPVGGGGSEPSGTGNAAPGGGRYGGIRRSVFMPGTTTSRDGGGATAFWGLGLTVLACLMTGMGILTVMPVLEPAARGA